MLPTSHPARSSSPSRRALSSVGPSSSSHASSSANANGGGSPQLSTGRSSTFGGNAAGGGGGGGVSLKTWLRRLRSWPQMDFELAAWQLTYLCIAPRRVYRNVYYHKQTKNTWARDDPAILLLISSALIIAALLWSTVYAHFGPGMTARMVARMVLLDFFGVGVLVATLLWAIANRFLTHNTHTHATDQRVEWPYAFDVHANSFFPFALQLYFAQLLLSPVVTRSNWVCLWVGNTLYLSAFTQYVYVTYLGYNALPFLIRSELLLFPIVLLFVMYIVSLLGFNVSKGVLGSYFGV